MLWIVEMQSGGVFEAATKRKIVDSMIQHFAENDDSAAQIKAIFCVFKDDRTDELCQSAVSKMQDIIDEGVSEWRKSAEEEAEGQREIERDFYANLT